MLEPIEITISSVSQLTDDVKSFTFNLGSKTFDYLPGQYLQVLLPIEKDQCDTRCNIRSYSIASSPTETEKTGQVMIATKFALANSSVFKQHLANFKASDRLQIRGPMGRFLLQDDYSKEAVMLSGGIGITPFRNMVKFATDKGLPLKITLLYSNKTTADIVWRDQFDEFAAQNPNLKLVHTITNQTKELENWPGERGFINAEMIKKYVSDINNAIFYLCGPPAMVDALKQVLLAMNIAQENIRYELFAGY